MLASQTKKLKKKQNSKGTHHIVEQNKCTWEEDQTNTAQVSHDRKQKQHSKSGGRKLTSKLEG